jgi:preprotein translocase subunit YajC
MSAEAGTKAGNTQGLGVNSAIMYLAVFPYLIISTIAFLFWRNYKRKQKEEKELAS